MSLPDKAFPVSWDQFHRDARALAWRLADNDREWRAIVCITRGGLVPAAIVSRELNIRLIETVCVASYHDYVSQGEMHVLKGRGHVPHRERPEEVASLVAGFAPLAANERLDLPVKVRPADGQ